MIRAAFDVLPVGMLIVGILALIFFRHAEREPFTEIDERGSPPGSPRSSHRSVTPLGEVRVTGRLSPNVKRVPPPPYDWAEDEKGNQ